MNEQIRAAICDMGHDEAVIFDGPDYDRKDHGKLDLAGRRFGKLTVIEEVGRTQNGKVIWKCKCDCGGETNAIASNLKNGISKSCGCQRTETLMKRSTTHGGRRTRLYQIWCNMKQRCKNVNYPDYGGRGIEVCEEWKNSFEAFRDWALANGYRDDLTIERKDVNGDYCPENCTWATRKAQNNNTRNNHFIEYNGQTKTISQWAEIIVRCFPF